MYVCTTSTNTCKNWAYHALITYVRRFIFGPIRLKWVHHNSAKILICLRTLYVYNYFTNKRKTETNHLLLNGYLHFVVLLLNRKYFHQLDSVSYIYCSVSKFSQYFSLMHFECIVLLATFLYLFFY